jgi:hypothetical protein
MEGLSLQFFAESHALQRHVLCVHVPRTLLPYSLQRLQNNGSAAAADGCRTLLAACNPESRHDKALEHKFAGSVPYGPTVIISCCGSAALLQCTAVASAMTQQKLQQTLLLLLLAVSHEILKWRLLLLLLLMVPHVVLNGCCCCC